MQQNFRQYADSLVKDFLQLKNGDALSINTEEQDLEYAKTIANSALPVTDVTVKIVVTLNGHPSQVLEFDPEGIGSNPQGFAMLRLAHVTRSKSTDDKVLQVWPDMTDLVAVQKIGHLAEPVLLSRRIAVPWCVAYVFDEDDDEGWKKVFDTISNDVQTLAMGITYRRQFLKQADVNKMVFKGENCDFSINVPEDSSFIGGPQKLSNGRTFIPGTDFEKLSCILEKNSLNGSFKAVVKALGKEFDCNFKYENGTLVDYAGSKELKWLFEADENLMKPGYLTMSDKQFKLYLGGSLSEALPEDIKEESDIPSYFNTSLYSIELSLEDKLGIHIVDCKGKETELVRKGFFLE